MTSTQDLGQLAERYDDAPDREPMRGGPRPDQPRWRPTTDQLRARRRISRTAGDQEDQMSDDSPTVKHAKLMERAGVASTDAERRDLVARAEAIRLQSARDASWSALTVQDMGELPPEPTMTAWASSQTTADSDWLLGLAEPEPLTREAAQAASHEMVVQASRWFDRLPVEVLEHTPEFRVQASGRARALTKELPLSDRDGVASEFVAEADRLHTLAVATGKVTPLADAVEYYAVDVPTSAPLRATASAAPELDDLDMIFGQHTAAQDHPDDFSDNEDDETADDGIDTTAASRLPQLGENGYEGIEESPMSSLQPPNTLPPEATSSMRAPVWAELQQSSPITPTPSTAVADNGSAPLGANDHATSIDHSTFPVQTAASITTNPKEASMAENAQFAQCPSCGGHGKVAVRQLSPREAASGLPQIDQIVDAQENPAATPLPTEVAFGLDTGGWLNDPRQDTINTTEQQIADRNGRSVLPGMGGRNPGVMGVRQAPPSAQRREATGRDNSGWMGDMGAKGTDYPGYSEPVPSDPHSLGLPEPIYGYGGDQGNRVLLQHSPDEDNDVTNGAQQAAPPYGVPLANDMGAREVSPVAQQVGQGIGATNAALSSLSARLRR